MSLSNTCGLPLLNHVKQDWLDDTYPYRMSMSIYSLSESVGFSPISTHSPHIKVAHPLVHIHTTVVKTSLPSSPARVFGEPQTETAAAPTSRRKCRPSARRPCATSRAPPATSAPPSSLARGAEGSVGVAEGTGRVVRGRAGG